MISRKKKTLQKINMSNKKKIIYGSLVILILIQFIRPAKNKGELDTESAIYTSEEIGNILQTSCFDCHSNNTTYPWYVNIQPVGWWLNHHVNEGKEKLNFSEFENYPLKKKLHKLKEIKEQIEKGDMPMTSYTLIHKEAKLNSEQKELLIKWSEETAKYLTDTIIKK